MNEDISSDEGFDSTEPLPLTDSPTQMLYGGAEYAPYRGCVLGNIAVTALCAVCGAAVMVFLSYAKKKPLVVAAASFSFPGILVVPFSLLMQPIVMSALTLLMWGAGDRDVAIGVFGLLFVVAVLAYMGWMQRRWVPIAVAYAQPRVHLPRTKYKEAPLRFVLEWVLLPLRVLTFEGIEWRPAAKRETPFFDGHAPLFDVYKPGRWWFLWVEMGTSLVMGLLTALGNSNSPAAPNAVQLSVANTVLSGVLVLGIVANPYNGRLGMANYAPTNIVLFAVSILPYFDKWSVAAVLTMSQVYFSLLLAAIDVVTIVLRIVVLVVATGRPVVEAVWLYVKLRMESRHGADRELTEIFDPPRLSERVVRQNLEDLVTMICRIQQCRKGTTRDERHR